MNISGDLLLLNKLQQEAKNMKEEVPILYNETIKLNAKKIIDLGVQDGWSTRAFLLACKKTDGHVWSVDIRDYPRTSHEIKNWGLSNRWSFFVMNDLEFIKLWNKGLVDIVMIDTSHTYDQTLKELEEYSKIVRKGGIILLHDIYIHRRDVKVKEAMIDFLKQNPGWKYSEYKTECGLARLEKL